MELLQPHIETILTSLLAIIASIIIAMLIQIRQRVIAWIEGKTSKDQRELLHKWAEEAFSFAETVFYDVGGAQKLDAAYGYFSNRLKEKGIDLSESEIRSIIEKAVLDYNKANT